MLYVVFMGCLVPEQTSKNVYVYKTILLYLSLLLIVPAPSIDSNPQIWVFFFWISGIIVSQIHLKWSGDLVASLKIDVDGQTQVKWALYLNLIWRECTQRTSHQHSEFSQGLHVFYRSSWNQSLLFFIKTWQGALMMRIISDGKGGHWGRCGARSSSEDPLLCGANDVICHWLAGIVFLAERHPAPLYHPREAERERAPKPIASAKGQRRSGTFFWHAWRQRQANGSISWSLSSAVALRLCTPSPCTVGRASFHCRRGVQNISPVVHK